VKDGGKLGHGYVLTTWIPTRGKLWCFRSDMSEQ